MKPADIDPADEMKRLLADYGCSATEGGFRRLAILLALEAGKLPAPEFTPHHDDTLKLNGLALLADAVARPAMSKVAIAHAAHAAGPAIGIDQYKTPKSVRAVLGKHEAEAKACIERARVKNALPPQMRDKVDFTALDLAALFPTQAVGQVRLDDWWVTRLTRAGENLSSDRSGIYYPSSTVHITSRTRLIGISIIEDEFDQPDGAPRKGGVASPVRAIIEDDTTHEIPGDAGPILHRRTDRVVPPPMRCLLRNGDWAWSGALDDGLRIEMRGVIRTDGPHARLSGEMTVTPAKNRSWTEQIACVRSTVEPSADL